MTRAAVEQEAAAILAAAAAREPVTREQLERFARSYLELYDGGRAALAVLDADDEFVGRRALELAVLIRCTP